VWFDRRIAAFQACGDIRRVSGIVAPFFAIAAERGQRVCLLRRYC